MASQATQLDSRHIVNSVFNNWLSASSEADFAALSRAREAFAPGKTCSMYGLVMGCLNDPTATHLLPESLVELLKEFRSPGSRLHVVGARFAEKQ